VQFLDRCAPVKISSSAEYSILQALQFQPAMVCRIPPCGKGRSHHMSHMSPYHPPVEGDTEIQYRIYKWNVSFVLL
jgi:hypothetical protein